MGQLELTTTIPAQNQVKNKNKLRWWLEEDDLKMKSSQEKHEIFYYKEIILLRFEPELNGSKCMYFVCVFHKI